MSTAKTGIEWTDRTWNPVRGCSRVSEGCRNCYAENIATRFSGDGQPFRLFADRNKSGSKWTGKVELVEKALTEPLRWRKPARIFVNSMSDLFHESLPDEAIDRVFAVMALCPQHTFQVLTKRAERMRKWFARSYWSVAVDGTCIEIERDVDEDGRTPTLWSSHHGDLHWPLPNVQLGVSVENNDHRDRIRELVQTPAALRFVSYEPALGQLDLSPWTEEGLECSECKWLGNEGEAVFCEPEDQDDFYQCPRCGATCAHCVLDELLGAERGISWVIAGGESGPGARPPHPNWFHGIRDQCRAAGIPFFFKQWGEYGAVTSDDRHGTITPDQRRESWVLPDGRICTRDSMEDFAWPMVRVGKKAAGALFDGREWRAFPARRMGGGDA